MTWPFPPREQVIESAEWLTDVIRAKGDEQRFAQRNVPLRRFIYQHTLTEEHYQAARAIIRQNGAVLCPEWPLAVNVGAVSSGASVVVAYGQPDGGIDIGTQVLLWQGADHYATATVIDTDSADTFTLDSVARSFSNARLVPLRTAVIPQGLQGSRPAGPMVQCSVEFDLTESEDLGASPYSQYQGDDLVSDCPVIAGESFAEPLAYPVDVVAPDVSFSSLFNVRSRYDSKTVMRWHVFTRSDLYTLRRFIHSRRGKWKAFWLSSFKRDFTLAQAVGAASTSILVYAPAGVTNLGFTSFDVEIAGTYNRRVTSYSTGTPVNGRATLQLNIAATGTAVPVSARVSYLRRLRFDADRIEFNHMAAGGVSVAVPCVELAQ